MESYSPSEKTEKTDENKTSDVKIVLWDFDGPINHLGMLGEIQIHYHLEDVHLESNNHVLDKILEKVLPKGSYSYTPYETTRVSELIQLSVLISNLKPLKATLGLLHENGVVSLVASQRITYGYAKENTIDLIQQLLSKKPLDLVSVQDIDGWRKALRKSVENQNDYDLLQPILEPLVLGNKKIDEMTSEIENNRNKLENILKTLKKDLEKEKALSKRMYDGIDNAFGKNREFLKQEHAETIGKKVALKGIDTSRNKFSYIEAAALIDEFKNIANKPNSFLVDDNSAYATNFDPGNFVHSPRTLLKNKDNFLLDNLYLAEVLLKNIPAKKLFADLDKLSDKETANQLKMLTLIVIGKNIQQKNASNTTDYMHNLRTILKNEDLAFLEMLLKHSPYFTSEQGSGNANYTTLNNEFAMTFKFQILSAYAKLIKDNETMSDAEKQTKLKGVIFSLIDSAKNTDDILFLKLLIMKLKDEHDEKYDLLRKGFLKFTPWNEIIEKIQKKSYDIVKDKKNISPVNDYDLNEIFKIQIKGLISSEAPYLKQYNELKNTTLKIADETSKSEKKP